MAKLLKISVLVVFLLVGTIAFSTRGIEARAMDSAAAVSPRSLYVQNCARCHGTNGRAQTREGRRVEADDLTTSDAKGISEAKMRRLITNGRGKMPGFGKKLTSAQISQIMGYVRGL